MIRATYNNYENDSIEFISFTNQPNIVRVFDETPLAGTKANIRFEVNMTNVANQDDGRFVIELFGETVSSVKLFENAINRRFWVSPSSNSSTAASIARALRNCQTLIARYDIEHSTNLVILTAKNEFDTDIQAESPNPITDTSETPMDASAVNNLFHVQSHYNGADKSNLTGALVILDIYKGDNIDYVTTLEKTCPDTEVSFNISPVITSLATHGKETPYFFRTSYITKNGDYALANDVESTKNYVVIGGDKWEDKQVKYAQTPMIMMDVERGTSWDDMNNHTLLYTYFDSIPLTIWKGNLTSDSYEIVFRDSAFQEIHRTSNVWRDYDGGKLYDIDMPLVTGAEQAEAFDRTHYVDIDIVGQTIRFNVIKPIKAAEDAIRLYWRNAYGGLSFFDFTGKITESSSIEDILTYEKNDYDYYWDLDVAEQKKIYDKHVERSITLKSHILEKDAKYLFNDLEKSTLVYLWKDRKRYEAIVETINFDEMDNANDLYEATVKLTIAVNFK